VSRGTDASKLRLRPIDLERHADVCVRFRRDTYRCSFRSEVLFEVHFGGDVGYVDWLREQIASVPVRAMHLWRGSEIIGQFEMTPRAAPETSYVSLVYLAAHERGTGAGDVLHGHVVRLLRERGATCAELDVAPRNTRAVRYYEKHGWKSLGPNPRSAEVQRMRLELEA
jgi:GNAT superfamily N-acetyltransferase